MAAPSAPTHALGTLATGSGFVAGTGQTIYDELEHVSDLQWPLSVRTYGRMRIDPTLQSIIAAYVGPIVRARWAIAPRGASETMVRICADSLGLPILGEPDEPGPTRSRGVQWTEHLRLATSGVLVFGHMPFEPVYSIDGLGRAVLASLWERLPVSISTIDVDDSGMLSAIQQRNAAKGYASGHTIPADRLLWYVREREGASWTGRSLLRHAFGPWLLKQDMMRVQGTSLRRFGAGTPVMEALPGTSPTQAQIAQAQQLASSVRVGDSGGAALPGWVLKILGVQGTLPDAMPYLLWLDQQMARGALTSVLDLGNTGHGSRALGSHFMDVLALAQQSTAELIATTASNLCIRLTDFNEGSESLAPAVVVGDVAASRAAMAESIGRLIEAGAIEPDEELDAWMRETYDLPPRSTPYTSTLAPPKSPTVQVTARKGPRHRKAVAAAASGGRRQLTSKEADGGLDPDRLAGIHETALAAVLAAWPQVADAQRDAIDAQVAAALEDGDLSALAAMSVDTSDAADILAVAMAEAADGGAAAAVAEAAHQGVTIALPSIDSGALERMAVAVTAVMGAATAAAAGREALRLAGSSSTSSPEQVSIGVRMLLDSMSGTWPQDQLGGAISDGLAAGRFAVFQASPDTAEFFASEVLDRSTCHPCQAIDGTKFESLDEAQRAYGGGGYDSCEGRSRCRGIIWASY